MLSILARVAKLISLESLPQANVLLDRCLALVQLDLDAGTLKPGK